MVFSSILTTDGGIPIELPSRLYKFMKREFAGDLYLHGQFRVGTLYDFRKTEKHSHGVLDVGEGTLDHIERVSADGTAGVELTRYSERMIPGGLPRGVIVRNMSLRGNNPEPDCYVYCLSLSPSWDNDISPEYDTCIEICDPPTFVALMMHTLVDQGLARPRGQFTNCVYEDRHHVTTTVNKTHTGGPPARPALLKPHVFKRQQEFRLLFEAASNPISFVDARVFRITNSCRWHSKRR